MSLIFIECLFLSACLIFLMGINPFVKKWKNLVLYACGGFFLTLIVSYVFLCFFEVALFFYPPIYPHFPHYPHRYVE